MAQRAGSKTRARVRVVSDGQERRRGDYLATEEPLEVRLVAGGATERLAVTMRTPGNDFELAAGFLHGEGILADREALRGISYCTDPELDAAQQYNVVNVRLDGAAMPDLRGLERHFYTSSACGGTSGGTTPSTRWSAGPCSRAGSRWTTGSCWSAAAPASRSCRRPWPPACPWCAPSRHRRAWPSTSPSASA